VLIVQKLIEKKANINKTDLHTKSILSYALDNDLTKTTGQDILKHLLNQRNIASSIQDLDLSQYNQLLQFILNRPSTAASQLPIIKLNDRLVKMLKSSTEGCSNNNNPLIQSLKNVAQDQNSLVCTALQTIIQPNKAQEYPMVLAIEQNHIDLIEALLPYQSIDERSLPFWQMCLAAVCAHPNVQILQLLSKKLNQTEEQNILTRLLDNPLDKEQTKTALFYAIEHSSQLPSETAALISCFIDLKADLTKKLPVKNKHETPLLYALSRKVGLDVLEPFITSTSLKDVNKANQGVLWYACFMHQDVDIIKHIIHKLYQHNILLPEISQVITKNTNTELINILDEYLVKVATERCMDNSDFEDLGNTSDWQLPTTTKKQKNPAGKYKQNVESYFKSNKKPFDVTRHLLDRQKERNISDDILYKLILENLSQLFYQPTNLRCTNKNQEKIIILNGSLDNRTFCVIIANSARSTSVLTTYWVSSNPIQTPDLDYNI